MRVDAAQSDILDIAKFTCTENIITAKDKSTVAQVNKHEFMYYVLFFIIIIFLYLIILIILII